MTLRDVEPLQEAQNSPSEKEQQYVLIDGTKEPVITSNPQSEQVERQGHFHKYSSRHTKQVDRSQLLNVLNNLRYLLEVPAETEPTVHKAPKFRTHSLVLCQSGLLESNVVVMVVAGIQNVLSCPIKRKRDFPQRVRCIPGLCCFDLNSVSHFWENFFLRRPCDLLATFALSGLSAGVLSKDFCIWSCHVPPGASRVLRASQGLQLRMSSTLGILNQSLAIH